MNTTEWYLFSEPAAETVAVAFLEGKETPTIETFGMDKDPEKLQVTWRCVFDFGVALGDPAGAVKSAGA